MSKNIRQLELGKFSKSSVKGTLILKDEIPFLVDDGGNPGICIRLEPADAIKSFLLDKVPCRLGGRYLYEEDAEVSLTLTETAVAKVDHLTIYQDESEFHFRV